MSKANTGPAGGGEEEARLNEISRKARMAATNRKSLSEDSQNTIRKQRVTIEKLKKENDGLREELATLTRNKPMRETVEITKRGSQLSQQFQVLSRKYGEDRRRLEDLDRQIKIMAARIKEMKSKRGGVHQASESDEAVQRQIKLLENRLDKGLIKFNEALANNRELREEIDNLRTERQVFDEIYKKLERDLHEKKKEMAEIIERSNVAYEERDQCQNELVALKQAYERENQELDRLFQELDAEMEKDRKRKAHLRMLESAAAAGDNKAEDDGAHGQRAQWNEAVEMASHEVTREKVDEYEEAIRKIKDATDLDDLHLIVEKFIQAEEQNFSLFNYVNDLNNEIEKLEEQIGEMRGEIAQIQGQGAESNTQQERIIAELEGKLNAAEEKSSEYESKHDEQVQVLDRLRGGIEHVFREIGCELGPVAEVLGDSGVTDSNMMQYLGIIEQRANELLQLYAAIQGPELSAEFGSTSQSIIGAAVFGMGPSTPFGATVLDIKPPAAGDDLEGDDSGDETVHPLTRQELQDRARASAADRRSNSRSRNRPKGTRSRTPGEKA